MYASRTTKTICENHTNTVAWHNKVGNEIGYTSCACLFKIASFLSEMVPYLIFTHRCGDELVCLISMKITQLDFSKWDSPNS